MPLQDIIDSWRLERQKIGSVIDGSTVLTGTTKKTNVRQVVQSTPLLRISESEKKYNQELYTEIFVEKPKSKVETSYDKTDTFHAWFRAYLSENPHYIYLHKTKSSFSNNVWCYWFLDTSRNVTVIVTKHQINERIKI